MSSRAGAQTINTAATPAERRIIIIGGSIAGLFAGLLLRKLGWSVAVFERATEALANRGAGITTHDALYAAFRQADIELKPAMGAQSVGRIMFSTDGTTLGTYHLPQILTSWGLLYRFLRNKFPDDDYHHGHTLSDIELDSEGVTVSFENGHVHRGAFLIGADGIRSTTRTICDPECEPSYVGYTAWRGLVDEKLVPRALLESAGDRMAFCLPQGEHFLGYIVAGPGDDLRTGHRWYNWVWYRPAPFESTLRELLTGRDGIVYEDGIPHHLIRPELIDDMKNAAVDLLAPLLADTIAATATPFLQPIFELGSERLVFERCMLIGDAAFTARPHIGIGVSKAADDAASLAKAFCHHPASTAGGVPQSSNAFAESIGAWETQRLRFGRAAVEHSRNLGAYVAGPSDDPAIQRLHAYYRQPEVVMAQIAAGDPHRYLRTRDD